MESEYLSPTIGIFFFQASIYLLWLAYRAFYRCDLFFNHFPKRKLIIMSIVGGPIIWLVYFIFYLTKGWR
jgi:hypothetical protein